MLLIAVLTALKLLSFLVFINHHNTFGAINDPEPDSIKNKIALVEPTFTYAAYQNDSFYNFFHEYRPTPRNVDIVTDLDLLRDRVVPSEPFIHYKAPERGPTIPHGGFHRMVEEHVRAFAPESNITRIGDQHVHNGTIFQGQENVYDLLVLFHNEYLTQQEYDNLRRFVENGGTILFTMSNVLYAEVAYNEINNTITPCQRP